MVTVAVVVTAVAAASEVASEVVVLVAVALAASEEEEALVVEAPEEGSSVFHTAPHCATAPLAWRCIKTPHFSVVPTLRDCAAFVGLPKERVFDTLEE